VRRAAVVAGVVGIEMLSFEVMTGTEKVARIDPYNTGSKSATRGRSKVHLPPCQLHLAIHEETGRNRITQGKKLPKKMVKIDRNGMRVAPFEAGIR
jgi:hypothetical protein